MNIQLAVRSRHDMPEEGLLRPITNKEFDYNMKPEGGFWTSSWVEEEYTSHWVQWCISEEFYNPFFCHWYLLEVRPDARIYHIDTDHDLWTLWQKYPRLTPETGYWSKKLWIDWEAVAKEWDGVHLTKKGAGETRWSEPIDLNCWDVESTVWFRWVFSSVKKIEPAIVLEGVAE